MVWIALVAACGGRGEEKPDRKAEQAEKAAEAPVDAWRADLRTLASELPARHVDLFFHAGEAEWRAAIADLEQRLPTLRQPQVIVEVMRIVAMIGDGHTGAWAESMVGRLRFPIDLYWFSDGIFVTRAEGDEAAVGARLVAVGGRPIDEVIALVTPIISRDNDAKRRSQAPFLLTQPIVVDGLGLADPDGRVTYRIATADGATRDLVLSAGPRRRRATGAADAPLGRRNLHLKYWNTYEAADRLVYIQYNQCKDDPDYPIAKFTAGTLGFLDQNPVDKVVLDLRNNSGGDSGLLLPLIDGLVARKLPLYVLIGRETFSSALLNAMHLDQQAGAVLIGEPTGGSPTHYGQTDSFTLPGLGVRVQYSTRRHVWPQYTGDALEPEIRAEVSSADHFSGRDPALEAARKAVPVR